MKLYDVLDKFCCFMATCFYIGYIKFAPGTFGSLFGLIIGMFICKRPETFSFCLLFMSIASTYCTYRVVKNKPNQDPGYIVIDEVVGQLISMGPIILLVNNIRDHFLLVILSFILFRIFDILKPWPISVIDKLSITTPSSFVQAFCIILDDILAGMISGFIVYLIIIFNT